MLSALPPPSPRRALALLVWFAAALGTGTLRAAPVLAPVFGDHAVLQRDQPVPVWGSADPGEPITVTFGSQRVKARADDRGRWTAWLAPMPASAAPGELAAHGKAGEATVAKAVCVGDVWLCSGQSNMEWAVRQAGDAQAIIAAATQPLIRHFDVKNVAAADPVGEVTGSWAVGSPDTAGAFTAVGYAFAEEIHRATGVPIGLINSSWGGTPIESWMAPWMIQELALGSTITERWSEATRLYPEKMAAFEKRLQEWNRAASEAKAAGQPPPPNKPRPPAGPGSPHAPSALWRGMIAPLVAFPVRGVLWYQGESNAARSAEYAELFPAMIRGWRAEWKAPALPFLFVQLANFESGNATSDAWAKLREAQAAATALPACAMAVAIDIGDSKNFHPANKREVGRRLALAAQAVVYGKDLDHRGPAYRAHSVKDGAVRIEFDHAENGLVQRGDVLQGFAVAGADQVFVPATARIEKNTVIVSADTVTEPVAVRYAFANDPQPPPNLFDGSGLPAVPFRTDRW